jgi:hypothetical protein
MRASWVAASKVLSIVMGGFRAIEVRPRLNGPSVRGKAPAARWTARGKTASIPPGRRMRGRAR